MAKDTAAQKESAAQAELVQKQIESLEAQLQVLKGKQPEHVPQWRRHQVRATGKGYANNRLYEPGEDFVLVLDSAAKPASWYELLDEGEAVKSPENRNANDFARAETAKVQGGFGHGQAL